MFKREHVECVTSTQDYAKARLKNLTPEHWLLFTADNQTNARGTHNRKWVSPSLVNIYATYVVAFPNKDISLLLNLPQVTAYSIAQTLEELGFKPKLKWINDILLNKKKVCGILCESDSPAHLKEHFAVSIGIGINVNMPKLICDNLDQPATSLLVEGDRLFDKEDILSRLSNQLEKNIKQLIQNGFSNFLTEIVKMQEYLGEKIKVDCDNEIKEGIMLGLNSQGMLILKTEKGIEELFTGRIIKKHDESKNSELATLNFKLT